MILNLNKSDTIGALASTLCVIHCLMTPLLFAVQSYTAVQHEAVPLWWKNLDFLFVTVSVFAVYLSTKNSSNTLVKYALWISWLSLFVLILNEKIGIQRWLAVLFGFLGVLIILDPTNFIISFDAVLPILGAFVLGFYTILTRKVSKDDSSETSFFWVAIVGCIVMSIVGPFYWEPILYRDWGWMALLCVLSTVGHFLLIQAYENAEASVLQPFTYFQLFFASIIGIIIFNDIITLSIFIGGIIVVGSGVFSAWRNYINNKKISLKYN